MARAARMIRGKRQRNLQAKWLAALALVWSGGCFAANLAMAEDTAASVSSRRTTSSATKPKEEKLSLVDIYRAKTGAKPAPKAEQPPKLAPITKPNLVPAVLKTAATEEEEQHNNEE